jgi:type I restriction enzyme S subunit
MGDRFSFPTDAAGIEVRWASRRLSGLLDRNDSGVWGDDPCGQNDVLVLRSTDQAVDGEWRIDDPAVRSLAPKERLAARLEAGDLVVTKSSGSAVHIGKTSLVDDQIAKEGYCYSNFMQRLRPGGALLPKFLWYFMNSPLAREQLGFYSSTTTGLANLNGTTIGRVELPLPIVALQSTVVEYLDAETARIDALIDRKQRFIDLLLEKRTALITHAVTKGLDPSVEMKDSGVAWIGSIPCHWDAVRIKQVARLESGHTPSRQHPEYWVDCTVPWITTSEVWQVRDGRAEHITETKEKVSELGLANSSARKLPAGTVVLSRTASVGFSAIMPVEMATSQDFADWVPGPRVTSEYLLYTFRSMRREFDRLMMGSTHQTIYMPDIRKLEMPLPPLEEQWAVVDHVRRSTGTIDSLVDKTRRSIDLLREYRTALIAAAVTGQIDIPGTETSEDVA